MKPIPSNDTTEPEFESAVGTLDLPEPIENQVVGAIGPQCEKCGATLKSDVVTICPKCGWYPSLGQFVEIDQDWEVFAGEEGQPDEKPRPSHLEVWLSLLPWWAWVLIGTAIVVVVGSFAVRLVTSSGSTFRTVWSLSQLGIGLLAFLGCHFFNFLVAAAEDADFGVLDVLLKPAKLWSRAVRYLPERLWVTNTAFAGLTAAAMSLIVIGGLPYDRFWDWGIEKPADQNLMGAVVNRMKEAKGEGSDNLEDAVGDFAGSQNVTSQVAAAPPPPEPRKNLDCIILGYRLDGQDQLHTLVLGAAHRQQLVHVGNVTPQLSDDELAELKEQLVAVKTDHPFLTVQTSAIWVEPKFTCRVTYTKRSKTTGRLLDIQWDAMLGEMNLP
jgi:hypothetical protein